jgi:NTE family protein
MTLQRRRSRPARKTVNLALQGGGSHGAFTWGVLDALLEDGRVDFEAVTGASAGAMNAVLLAEGWRRGRAAKSDPRDHARERLRAFWAEIGRQPNPFAGATALAPLFGGPSGACPDGLPNPAQLWLDVVSRIWSPYQLNPWNINPLRSALAQLVDFDALRATPPFKLFLCATNVRSGRVRIFRESELVLEMPLASACLPLVFQAVAIREQDGPAHYWDGGYLGNPALWPLFYATRSRDLVLVPINPQVRDEVPDTAAEIAERVNEISFNASLLHEMRAIEFVQRLLKERKVDPQHYRTVYLHMIACEERLRPFGARSKYDTSPAFLSRLFELGRGAALEWLEAKFDYVGHAGTVRIAEQFL